MKIKIWDDFREPIFKKKFKDSNTSKDVDKTLEELRRILKKKFE